MEYVTQFPQLIEPNDIHYASHHAILFSNYFVTKENFIRAHYVQQESFHATC